MYVSCFPDFIKLCRIDKVVKSLRLGARPTTLEFFKDHRIPVYQSKYVSRFLKAYWKYHLYHLKSIHDVNRFILVCLTLFSFVLFYIYTFSFYSIFVFVIIHTHIRYSLYNIFDLLIL